MRIPLAELQDALYDRIKLDFPTYSVYTFLPGQNIPFPYAAFSQFHAVPDELKNNKYSWVCSYAINVWSQSTGTAELSSILNGIIGALTRAELILANDWRVFSFDLDPVDVLPEIGNEVGSLQHGIIRSRIGIEDISIP
jgi:hypothetical protein